MAWTEKLARMYLKPTLAYLGRAISHTSPDRFTVFICMCVGVGVLWSSLVRASPGKHDKNLCTRAAFVVNTHYYILRTKYM